MLSWYTIAGSYKTFPAKPGGGRVMDVALFESSTSKRRITSKIDAFVEDLPADEDNLAEVTSRLVYI